MMEIDKLRAISRTLDKNSQSGGNYVIWVHPDLESDIRKIQREARRTSKTRQQRSCSARKRKLMLR